jgi:hypothetical protein
LDEIALALKRSRPDASDLGLPCGASGEIALTLNRAAVVSSCRLSRKDSPMLWRTMNRAKLNTAK